MDSSRQIGFSLDELRRIHSEVAEATSLDELRHYFDRVKQFRHAYAEDFDALIDIAALQDTILERARLLRERERAPASDTNWNGNPGAARPRVVEPNDAAEIPPEVERLDAKNWQRAIYIGLFFAIILFAAFFYLIQTARRLNLTPSENASPTSEQAAARNKTGTAQNASSTATPAKPTVRLYTDLTSGTVSIDEGAPQDLKDGELLLDNLQPGQHSMSVKGPGGDAAFSYDVSEKDAPRVIGLPTASNAMAVLVTSENGKARLVTNAENADVSLDGKPAGQAGTDGLNIDDLGKTDHLLQVMQGKDRQRFVLTYTPAPTLTVYVKSDPNAGTVVIAAKQDGADVYIDDKLYRRKTEAGQLRIPLKVGEYTIRVHKAGFIDPPPETVEVKKAEETEVDFRMDPAPQSATLQVKGALQGTMVYIDRDFSAAVGADGNATISNVKPGLHSIELRRDQAVPKKFDRSFKTGDVLVLSGPDVTLDKVVVENTTPPPPAPAAAPSTTAAAQNYGMEVEGQQIYKGGGFISPHTPHVRGRYTFAGRALKGGFLKRAKLSWYAAYQDSQNYVLFTVDGKHASVREVRDGKAREVNRIPFDADSSTWVQVDLQVTPNELEARIKTPDTGWYDLGSLSSSGRDFTQGKMGFYVPEKDEIAVSNFRFSAR